MSQSKLPSIQIGIWYCRNCHDWGKKFEDRFGSNKPFCGACGGEKGEYHFTLEIPDKPLAKS